MQTRKGYTSRKWVAICVIALAFAGGAFGATLDVSGGSLTYTAGGGVSNTFAVAVVGANYSISDSGETITLTANAITAGWTGSGTNTVSGPVSSVTQNFAVDLGSSGVDSLNINNDITVAGTASFKSNGSITIAAVVNASTIGFQATGAVTETTGSLQSSGGLLVFAGSATLNSPLNNVAQLAATITATDLNFKNIGDLAVTSVTVPALGITSFGTLSTGNTTIALTNGNLTLSQNVQAVTAILTTFQAIVAPAGSVVATNAALSAGSGIGTPGFAVPTTVTNLVAKNTVFGGIFINNTGNLTIGFAGDPFQGVIDSGSTADSIILNNAGTINITNFTTANEIISANGSVTVNATGGSSDIVTSAIQNNLGNANPMLRGAIVSANGSVTASAGRDLLFGNTTQGNVMAGFSLALNAGRNIVVDAGSTVAASAFSSNAAATLNGTAVGNISVNHAFGTASTIKSQGGAINLTVGAAGVFTADAASGVFTFDVQSNGGNITVTADTVTLTDPQSLSAGTGTVTIQPVSQAIPINLGAKSLGTLGLTSAELSQIFAGTLVIGSPLSNFNNVITVVGGVTVRPQALRLQTAASLTSAAGLLTLNNGIPSGNLTVTHAGSNPLTWAVSATSVNSVTLADVSALTINAGSGSDTFNIAPSTIFTTTVSGGNPVIGTAFPGDALNINFSGVPNSALNVSNSGGGLTGTYTLGGGFQSISFSGIESGVLAPPTIGKSFSTSPISMGGTTNLIITVSHSNVQSIGGGNNLTVSGLASLTGVGFSDLLPAGLAVANPLSATNSCGGSLTNGSTALAPGNTAVVLSGGAVPLNGNCTVNVVVTASTAGNKVNTTSAATALESGPGASGGTSTLVVSPTVTINAPTITYGSNGSVTVTVNTGTAPTPTGNITLIVDAGAPVTQALSGGSTTFTITAPAAGNHTLSATYSGDANYGAASQTGTLTVNKATLTVTADPKTITYGAAFPPFTATITGFVNGDTAAVVSGSPAFATNATTTNGNPNAGTWTITPSQGTLTAANYNFAFATGVLTVNKVSLTVTADPKTITYGTSPAFTASITGFVNGDTAAVVSGSPAFTTNATTTNGNPNAGAWTITPSQGTLSAANYTFAFATGVLTVNKASLTVTADPKTISYGTTPTFTATISGFVNGDTAAVVSGAAAFATNATTTNGKPDAGVWIITPSQGTLAAANYNFTTFLIGVLTVNKATLTVTADPKTITYGAAFPPFTATITGFINGDTSAVVTGSPSFTTNATTTNGNPNAGTWTITPLLGSLTATNYTFAFATGVLTVNKATLTVTADPKTITYGAAFPPFTATLTGFVNGDTTGVVTGSPSFTTNATTTNGNPNAGTWTITPSAGTLAAANYNFTFGTGVLTVNKANLNVTANNASKVVGAPVPALTFTITGFVNGDTSAVVSGAPVLTTTATASSAAGTYPINVALGTLAAANYTFTPIAGTLTVGKATTSTTLSPSGLGLFALIQVLTPGGGTPTGTVQFLNGSTVVATIAISAQPQGLGAFLASPPVGSITAVYSGDANFNGSTSNAVQIFAPATSSVNLTSSANPSNVGQSVSFTAAIVGSGGPPSIGAPTGSVTFLDNGKTLGTVNVSGGQAIFTTSSLTAGQHQIVAQYSGDGNYPPAQGTLNQNVNGAAVTMTASASPTSVVFGQTVTLSASVTAGSITGVAAPTGSVTFSIGSTTLGTATLSSTGAASITTTAIPVGTQTITAQYSGDSIWSSATRTITVTVGQASTTSVASLTLTSGQLSLNATVSPVAPGSGTPTGTVQFLDIANNNAVVATGTLNGGKVSASVDNTVIGRPIVAKYSGDTNFSASTSPSVPVVVNAAGVLSSVVAGDEIVSMFGITGISGDTPATSLPLGTTLGGVSLTITDSTGATRQPLLYGVFGSAGQINFLVPADLARGLAVVTVNLPGGATQSTVINIGTTAAGIFSASMNGQGVYAGQAVYQHANNTQTVADSVTGNPAVPNPVKLGTPGDQVVLVLYATGLRNAKTVTATINGVAVPVAFYGAQGQYVGLDQINLGPLPSSLAGTGSVNVVITADGQPANTVTVTFQ